MAQLQIRVKKEMIRFLGMAALVIFVAGCYPKSITVDGEIFIVTKGGMNYKLGRIEVKAVSYDKEFLYHENAVFPVFKNMIEKKLNEFKEIKSLYENASSQIEDYYVEYQELEYSYNELKSELEKKSQIYGWSVYPNRGANHASLKKQVEMLNKKHSELAAIGKKISSMESVALFHADNAEQLKKEITTEHAMYAPAFIETMRANISTKTDANGRFSLVIPSEGNYYVMARASRSVGAHDEYYQWFMPVRHNRKNINIAMSNDNMVDRIAATSEAHMWQYKLGSRISSLEDLRSSYTDRFRWRLMKIINKDNKFVLSQ